VLTTPEQNPHRKRAAEAKGGHPTQVRRLQKPNQVLVLASSYRAQVQPKWKHRDALNGTAKRGELKPQKGSTLAVGKSMTLGGAYVGLRFHSWYTQELTATCFLCLNVLPLAGTALGGEGIARPVQARLHRGLAPGRSRGQLPSRRQAPPPGPSAPGAAAVLPTASRDASSSGGSGLGLNPGSLFGRTPQTGLPLLSLTWVQLV